jgi:uncharacterized protein
MVMASGARLWQIEVCVVALLALAGCRRGDKAPADDMSTRSSTDAPVTIPFNASIDCTKASSDVEQLVCSDPSLSALDQKLGTVYKEAEAKQGAPVPGWFVNEQRDWNADRDACGKASSMKSCVDSAYTRRIAAIQARNLLVPTKGPVTYSCPLNGDHGEVVAMFADTDPPAVVLERGDKSVVAYFVKTASGARYEGKNVTFVDRSGDVQILWLGTALKCREQAPSS